MAPQRPASYDKKVALVLQGGGALGSYQAGVYEALATSDYPPDWVAGISIGAINAALIAGNAPEDRVDRLRAFWDEITLPPSLWPGLRTSVIPDTPTLSAAHALLFGQPGFFTPRPAMSWLFGGHPTSYYDTSALKTTLERLVDFDRINAREIRFSVGAVNVETGNFAYFDNAKTKIRPEHIMASGALPPGFPPIEIDGQYYWDGGLVSNTPLQYVLDYVPRRSRLTFQVDLFAARGPVPTDLEGVAERDKDIRYSSRTRAGTDMFRTMHDVRHVINDLLERMPELRETREGKFLYEFGCVTTMDIVELIYRPAEDQGSAKDYEFGHSTMLARWAEGLSNARVTLDASPWLAPMPPEVGVRTFDVLGKSTGDGTKLHQDASHDAKIRYPSQDKPESLLSQTFSTKIAFRPPGYETRGDHIEWAFVSVPIFTMPKIDESNTYSIPGFSASSFEKSENVDIYDILIRIIKQDLESRGDRISSKNWKDIEEFIPYLARDIEIPVKNSPLKGVSLETLLGPGTIGGLIAAGHFDVGNGMIAIAFVSGSMIIFGAARGVAGALEIGFKQVVLNAMGATERTQSTNSRHKLSRSGD